MDDQKLHQIVKDKLEKEPSGHDYQHACRVLKNAQDLQTKTMDKDVIFAAALVHDLIDHKLDQDYKLTIKELQDLLISCGLTKIQVEHVLNIITNMSFSSGLVPPTIEGKIVQDADRLDALGAVGIARTFAYGAKNNRLMYQDPNHMDTVQHFYDKLFTLDQLMNTDQAKTQAKKRIIYMKEFIMKLGEEIGGKL